MLSTVAGLHPKSCAIENFDRPTALMRIMVALRKTVLSVVPKRISSNASHCSAVNVHVAMTTSVQLKTPSSCTEFIDQRPPAEVLLRVYLALGEKKAVRQGRSLHPRNVPLHVQLRHQATPYAPYMGNPLSELPLDRFRIEDAKPIFAFDEATELAFFKAASDWVFRFTSLLPRPGYESEN